MKFREGHGIQRVLRGRFIGCPRQNMPLEHAQDLMLEFPTLRDQVDRDRQRLLTVCIGVIRAEDLAAHLEHLENCGVISYDHFTDLSEARFPSNTETGQLRWLAELIRTKSPLGKTAYLVGDDLAFGLSRMLSAFVEPDHTIKVFRQRLAAFEWLGWTE
jgi:hypothetical protein